MNKVITVVALIAFGTIALDVNAWDPPNGDWSKSETTDLRVMTWNVEDDIRTEISKTANSTWDALVRIVAGMRPDVLIIQEAGDNDCSGCLDSVAELTTVLELFLYGGEDPFITGNPTVESWVQLFAPDYDLPYIFVPSESDGYNRNAILSRYPFADLNGDTKDTLADIPTVFADEYVTEPGDGGIRGFQFAEIDLPDETYVGDVVVGNAHLKSGGSSDDLAQRLEAAQRVAYVIDYWYNGAGEGIPDPHGKIWDSPAAQQILGAETAVIIGGDWNEDEQTNGRKGPADWLTMAEITGAPDGTDRDRSDMTYDTAVDYFNGYRRTQGSGSGSTNKLDYIAWQDSIAVLRQAFVFYTGGSTPADSLPSELDGYFWPSGASQMASDHRPVIADFILSTAGCENDEDCDDFVACTVDTCVAPVCENTPDDDLCDNGLFCDGLETCDPELDCQAGESPCLTPYCRESDDRCVDCLQNSHCEDGDWCNGSPYCTPEGTCTQVLTDDCNGNGIEDLCDLDASTSEDCNTNGIPDECDIESGTSLDTNGDGIPDECAPTVPTVSTWGLVVMLLGMVATCTVIIIRNGRSHAFVRPKAGQRTQSVRVLTGTFLAWTLLTAGAFADQPAIGPDEGRPHVSWQDAGKIIGRTAFVHGQIREVLTKGRVTLLNFGPSSGPEGFSVVVFQQFAANFSMPLREMYQGKLVRVRGGVSTYGGRPQIYVTTPDQIEFLQDLPSVPPLADHEVQLGDTITVATFNILNLFDDVDDPYRNDDSTPTKPRRELERVAQAIRDINADVLALQEVESRGYLERFLEVFLSDMGYSHVVHFESNDARGIDAALVSRVPVGPVTSYRHLEFPDASGSLRRFGRDLLGVRLEPERAAPFEVWVVHLKSNYDGRAYAEPIRVAEAKKIREILDDRLQRDPDAAIALCGDFNDTWDSNTLQTLVGNGPRALRCFAEEIPKADRITYNREPYRSMIDFILSSPALAKQYVPGSYAIRTGSVDSLGSDHNPVAARFRLRLQP